MIHAEVPTLRPRSIGASVLRTEDPRLLTGRGRFVGDIALPGMLHCAFVRSPFGHARIVSLDLEAARGAPGVVGIWTGADFAALCPVGIPTDTRVEGVPVTAQPVLAPEFVRYMGEAVAVVVAATQHEAEDAAALVAVEWEELPAVVDAEAALAGGPLANETIADNLIIDRTAAHGDAGAAFSAAALSVSARIECGRYAAVPIEPRGVLASWDWARERLTMWNSTQVPHFLGTLVAALAGFPEQSIEVIAPDVGGGFGQKGHLFPEDLVVAVLARELKGAVRWLEDRRENLMTATHAKQQVHEIELALDGDGRLLGLRDRIVVDGGAYNQAPWSQLVEGQIAAASATGPYRVPNVETRLRGAVTNKCPVGSYRGVGWTAMQIARETVIDQAARRLGLSPFEIRRRNVVRPEE
ncbi:MAG: xanthine dehydrogenase family protein molybdopterin-binding subunit, partial [Actinobacteria bacterium]|nr:xanthine dehydrogenase family protein molybdopterin-binding subunit [Actinomycetota bacterium]